MKRTFLLSKCHNVKVTHADLDYEGSFGIDAEVLEVAGILPNEQIQVYNVSNGARFTTYAIPEAPGSRLFRSNGACAHLAKASDRIIICTYCELDETEISSHRPTILLFDENNEFTQKT